MSRSGRIFLYDPVFGPAEERAVVDVLRSGRLSQGPQVRAFEERCSAILQTDTVAVGSGTAALHLALLALDIGTGDEVILPAQTFVASAAMTRAVGARPVFADIVGEDDLTIDPADVLRRVTDRTRAIVAMHHGGWAPQLAALRTLADGHGLALIEDAAHAPFLLGPGGFAGTLGDIGCFSFFATKNVPGGEGGTVVARDPAILDRVRRLRSHAIARSPEGAPFFRQTYDVVDLGYNYRMAELHAAIAMSCLDRFEEEQRSRRDVAGEYRRRLFDTLTIPFGARPLSESAHHLFVVLLPVGVDRSRVQAELFEHGIDAGVHYRPTHHFTAYSDSCPSPALSRTDEIAERMLSLPMHPRLEPRDVARVANTLLEALESVTG